MKIILAFYLTVGLLVPGTLSASFEATNKLTNDTVAHATHPKPDSFGVSSDGTTYGVSENGTLFSQTVISDDTPYLKKFSIQSAWWYVSDKGIIGYGEELSDIQALSIYALRME